MTLTAQIAPPASVASLHTGWSLHFYDGHAFITHDGRIQATAPCRTPGEETRLIALLDRLIIRSARHR